MGIRTLVKRIEKAEEALKTQSIFSQDCICFPEKGAALPPQLQKGRPTTPWAIVVTSVTAEGRYRGLSIWVDDGRTGRAPW